MAEPSADSVLSPAALLGALRLGSAALPIGSFAYSQALEAAVLRGLVMDRSSTERWIVGLMSASILSNDVAFLIRLREAWDKADLAAVHRWGELLFATRGTKELRDEERQLGSALFRVLSRLGIRDADVYVADARATLASAYALAASRWQIPNLAVATSYCFAWAEGQVGAATRLVPLGQSDAQLVLSAAIEAIQIGIVDASKLKQSEGSSTAPGQALLSSWHEIQYSRLFRS